MTVKTAQRHGARKALRSHPSIHPSKLANGSGRHRITANDSPTKGLVRRSILNRNERRWNTGYALENRCVLWAPWVQIPLPPPDKSGALSAAMQGGPLFLSGRGARSHHSKLPQTDVPGHPARDPARASYG